MINIEKLQRDIKISYKKDLKDLNERIKDVASHVNQEWGIDPNKLSIAEIKAITSTIVELETKNLHEEVENLVAKKEKIEREIERKTAQLQDMKYKVFDAMEKVLDNEDEEALAKLHQVKLQTIDLFDILGEMVESTIISALEKEKDLDIDETLKEAIKELSYEAIKEGSLNTIRVRKILSTILQVAIDIAEAEPTKAKQILEPTLKGLRSGLYMAIDRFKQRLAFMPIEAKHILIEDYDTIVEDLNQSDTIFSQVINIKSQESSPSIKKVIEEIHKEMKFDLEELLNLSKETAEIMKEKFSSLAKTALKKSSIVLNSQTAKEAKRMGTQVINVAKNLLNSTIKSTKK
jgi:hypothetical protein